MQDTHISLAHGNGGRFMRELIDEIFARHLSNPDLDVHADAVPLAAFDALGQAPLLAHRGGVQRVAGG